MICSKFILLCYYLLDKSFNTSSLNIIYIETIKQQLFHNNSLVSSKRQQTKNIDPIVGKQITSRSVKSRGRNPQ